MNTLCTFKIHGVRKDGALEQIALATNLVTKQGIEYLLDSTGLKTFPYGIFLGGDDTPASFQDNGVKDLLYILPTTTTAIFSHYNDSFTTPEMALPLSTIKELSFGHYDGATKTSYHYNRAVLDTPIVLDETFYQTYRGIQINYTMDVISNISLGRKSEIVINGVTYTCYSYTEDVSNSNIGQLLQFKNYGGKCSGYSLRHYINDGTCTYNYDTEKLTLLVKSSVMNNGTASTQLNQLFTYVGSFVIQTLIRDSEGKGIPLAPGQTAHLEMLFPYTASSYVVDKLSEADRGIGPMEDPWILSNNTLRLPDRMIDSAYAIGVESGERINIPVVQRGATDAVGRAVEGARNSYSFEQINGLWLTLDSSDCWNVYGNFLNGEQTDVYLSTVVGTSNGKTVTFNAPSYTFASDPQGKLRLKLTNKPSGADKLRVYNSVSNTYTDKTILNDGSVWYVDFDTPRHSSDNAYHQFGIRYLNSLDTAQLGRYTYPDSYRGFTPGTVRTTDYPMVRDENLVFENAVTTPILNLKYDRANARVSGLVYGADKIAFINTADNERIEINVTPYSEFNIDLSEYDLVLRNAYRVVAVEDGVDSEGPVYNGFKSSTVPMVTDVVYNAANKNITFTRPDESVHKVTLRRWGFDFYTLILTDGTNVLNLSSTLAENGQWELVSHDVNGTESQPFYLFGPQPGDVAVKPDNSTPNVVLELNNSSTYNQMNVGFYPGVDATAWWENCEWYATIDDKPATVEFLGVKSAYPETSGSYWPYLSFRLNNGEESFEFRHDPYSNVNVAVWQVLGAAWKLSYNIKLWHDWIPFDGITESQVRYTGNTNTAPVTGIGNGMYQATEVSNGYVRRVLGTMVRWNSNNLNGLTGACPIDFDAVYRERTGDSIPSVSERDSTFYLLSTRITIRSVCTRTPWIG